MTLKDPKALLTGLTLSSRSGRSCTIPNRLILGPMAGVSDLPFRVLCKEMGAGLVCTEMISAKAVTYGNRNTKALIKTAPSEHPVSLQLFGSEPEVMAQAADMLKEEAFDILDVNMGCPVPKVAGNGEGSALMKKPELVYDIVKALCEASDRPVTVKIRKGFDEAHVNAVEVALAAQEAGASAVAVHGRTREQYYSGEADWSIIRKVKEALKVPVIGNGDVFSPEGAVRLFEETGCDAVMVARGARGNPWIFRQIISYISGEEPEKTIPSDEMKRMILRHAAMQEECKGSYIAMREMRKHVAWYTTGYPHSAKIRARVNEVETLESLEALLTMIFG